MAGKDMKEAESKKQTFIVFLCICAFFAVLLMGGTYFYLHGVPTSSPSTISEQPQQQADEVTYKQMLSLVAKGGYSPRVIKAKANVGSILNVQTSNTFDCSSAFKIPALKYSKNLPRTGVTSIDIPSQPAGTVIKGSCSMGMYNFSIEFS
jgi:hypothetical protein